MLSKWNSTSRKVNSIETALLEKMLMFDHAKKIEDANVRTILDLEAWNDWHMPELWVTKDELIEAKRKIMKLITKVLPRMENYAGVANVVGAKTHRDKNSS